MCGSASWSHKASFHQVLTSTSCSGTCLEKLELSCVAPSKTSSGTEPPPLRGRGSLMLCSMPAPPFSTNWQLLTPSCGSQSSPAFRSSSLRCVSQIFRSSVQGLQPSCSHACLQSLANFWLIDNTWPQSVRPTFSMFLTTQPQAVILVFFLDV